MHATVNICKMGFNFTYSWGSLCKHSSLSGKDLAVMNICRMGESLRKIHEGSSRLPWGRKTLRMLSSLTMCISDQLLLLWLWWWLWLSFFIIVIFTVVIIIIIIVQGCTIFYRPYRKLWIRICLKFIFNTEVSNIELSQTWKPNQWNFLVLLLSWLLLFFVFIFRMSWLVFNIEDWSFVLFF